MTLLALSEIGQNRIAYAVGFTLILLVCWLFVKATS